jgi:AraC family L-rhamnose operon transcriptional activator RhaR
MIFDPLEIMAHSCTILRMPPKHPSQPQTLEWQWYGRTNCGVHLMRADPQFDISPHDHLFHEIVFVESGSARHDTAGGTRPLHPGDVIIIRPQVWHAYQEAQRLVIVNCLIEPALLHRVLPLLSAVPGATDLFRRRAQPQTSVPRVFSTTPAQRFAFRQSLQNLLDEQQRQDAGWEIAATGLLLDLLVQAVRLTAPTAVLPAITEAAVLCAAQQIESHLADSLTLEGLAKQASVSPAHLSRSFRARMGMGVVDYLHRLRTEEACRLLRLTDLPITAIAQRLGYSEIAYFSRRFRACTGQAPRAYRAGHARQEQDRAPSTAPLKTRVPQSV